MTEQADERLRALNASLKEALGKLTGSEELEAQGVRERTGAAAARKAEAPRKAPVEPGSRAPANASAKPRSAPAAKTTAAAHVAKPPSSRPKG